MSSQSRKATIEDRLWERARLAMKTLRGLRRPEGKWLNRKPLPTASHQVRV